MLSKPVLIWLTSLFWLIILFLIVTNIAVILTWDQTLDQSPFLTLLLFLIIVSGQLLIVKRLAHARRVSLFPFWIQSTRHLKIGPVVILTNHHPAEQYLDAHEIEIRSSRICSGCYGTIIGIIIGLALVIIFGIVAFPVIGDSFGIMYGIGIVLVQLSFGKYIFPVLFKLEPTGKFRLALNASLPVGINLLLISMYLSQKSIILTFLMLFGLAIPLLFRLLFAQVEHTSLEDTHYPVS